MMNKFLAISLIVMIAFADASPLLKSWHAKQQRRMKSGAVQKASFSGSHQHKTTTISLSSATGGSRGRRLSLSDSIDVVVNNLVGGDGQNNIICKSLDRALKAGHAASPTIFYHEDLEDFVQSWRDVYNQDFTESLCAGKLHAIELAGQTNSLPQVCVGFNLLEDGVDDDGAVVKGNCPTFTTSWCADFKTDVGAATGSGTALTDAEDAIRTINVRATNTTYADAYALRLVDNGNGVESVTRVFHTTDLPSLSAISVGGCPGLALTIAYQKKTGYMPDTTLPYPDSSDPGNTYVPASGLPGAMEQVETGITNSIYEEDTTAYTINGTRRDVSSSAGFNPDFGMPKKYLVDANGDCPARNAGAANSLDLTINAQTQLTAGSGGRWNFMAKFDSNGDGNYDKQSSMESSDYASTDFLVASGEVNAPRVLDAFISPATGYQIDITGDGNWITVFAGSVNGNVVTLTSDYPFCLAANQGNQGSASLLLIQEFTSKLPNSGAYVCSTSGGGGGVDEFDYEEQMNAPVTDGDGVVTQTSKGYCYKLLNGVNGVSGKDGVTASGVAEKTTSAKAQEAIADVDSCPGTAAVVNYCSISDFAALITGQTVNGQTGSCVRRVYTDLCTEMVDSTYVHADNSTSKAHDHQLPGSDASNGKASYTKPLRISLPAGDYCDGYDSTSIGTCTLQRKLQNEFVFEMSCEQLAGQMTASGQPTDVLGVRKLSINWDIGTPHSELMLEEKDANVRADFHCAEDDNTGLCGVGIPATHPCHGIVKKVCANPYYEAESAEPLYTTYTPEGGSGAVTCAASDGALLTAWETAIGKTGSYRSALSINTELYDLTCHDLRKEIEEDAKPKILELCDHIQSDLDKARIDYATSYLLHDVQALKKVRQTNYKKHVTAYRNALDSTCESSFGSADVTSLSTADIEGLKEDRDDSSSKTLVAALEAAATTPEDVAINIQRQKIDQRVSELSESLNLLKEAYTDAAVPGIEVTAHIVKFNELAKVVYKTLARAFVEDIDTDNSIPEPFNTRVGEESACPHLGQELLKFTNVYDIDGILTSDPDLRRHQLATIDGTGSGDGLAIVLNDGTAKTITNLVSILEYLVATSTYASGGQSVDDRVDHLKEGLETLVAETVEYCIWESEDRFDRCETCAARKQLFNDKDIYQRVYTRLNTLSTYKSERATLIQSSCEAPILLDDEGNQPIGYPGGAGSANRIAVCSIPEQTVLSSLAGIDGTASYIKGYPGTGYDNTATEDIVETDQAHHRYDNGNNVIGSLTYDKTAFQNDLAACENAIVQLDARGCPSTTLNSAGEAVGVNDALKLSSTQELALNTAAAGVNATTGLPLIGTSYSTFEARRNSCLDALDIVMVDTADAYDCAVSDPSNSLCVDGSITHFVKQCIKTDGLAYVPHANPHAGAYNISDELNGPGIYQAIKAYTDAEDAYDAAVSARTTREGQLNIDPSELKNLNDDVHAAETYRDVILAHIGDLAKELKAFRNRHATVMTKCEDLVEAKVRAKVAHALELKKYDFEVEDLDAKKQAVNAKTYDGAKDALDEYCAEVAAVKDAVTIASLADVNKVVRAGSRCTYAGNGQPNSYATDSACCKALTVGDTLNGLADQTARRADCIAADLAIEASKLCVFDASTNLYNGHATKEICLDAISSGSGLGGECVKTLPDGSVCSLDDECASGVCRDTVYNVGVAVTGSDPVTYTYDAAVVKECAAEAYIMSGGNCTQSSDCRPFSSIRTANPPYGATQHGNSGRWTQVCNAVGVCSDYDLGNEDDECATAASGDGHVGSTCASGLVCDLWFGGDGVDDGASYNDDSVRRTNGYETTSAHVGTNGKDVCIEDPTCSDGLQNGGETGVDCGGSCTHLDVCVGEAAAGGSAQGSLAANGVACTFHSDCANGAACEQQYHYVLSDGVTSCDHTQTYYQDTCAEAAIAGSKKCGAAVCSHSSAPSPNSLYGQTVACAGTGTSTDPSESQQQLHQFTVNGITFTYYVQTASHPTEPTIGSGRRLLSYSNGLNSINTHGFNFIHPVLEHATQKTHRLQSVKQRHVEKLARRYQQRLAHRQRLSHGEGSIDHLVIANSVDHWGYINDFADADTNSSSDLSVCRVPRGSESGSDQQELARKIPCVGPSNVDCCHRFDTSCSLTCVGTVFDVERDAYGNPILDVDGETTQILVSRGLCSAVSPGNSLYTQTDLPEIDALGVCKDDSTGGDPTAFANDLAYSDEVAKKYGYKVSNELHLNRGHHQSRVRGRHLRQYRQYQKRLRHNVGVTHNDTYHGAYANPAPTYGHATSYPQYGVTDPSNSGSGLFPSQSDSERDCIHDGLKWCKFTKSGSSSGRGSYNYAAVPGFCTSNCANCKIGDVVCARTTDCLMQGAQVHVPSVKVNASCTPKWDNYYDTEDDCIDAGEPVCIQTHTCMMTTEQLATIGTPVDATKCIAVYASDNSTIIKYTIIPGQGDPLGGNDRPVDSNCDLSTGQDLSAIALDTHGHATGLCGVPAGQQTCQQAGNCGIGTSCSDGTECASTYCSSGTCAQVVGDYCAFTNSNSTLQALNANNGVGIDSMTVKEIKAQFISGSTEENIAIDTSAETTMIGQEKTCECSGLVAAAKSQGNDQSIIDEMESRIQELKDLLDDGHYADICTQAERDFCDGIDGLAGGARASGGVEVVPYNQCKSKGQLFAGECISCLSDYEGTACETAVTVNAHALAAAAGLEVGAEVPCITALGALGVTNKAESLAMYAQAAFLSTSGHTIGTTGCEVYELDESMEGAAIKQIHEAKEKLRLYLTNTASGAQEIANLESTEATKLAERNAARTAALEYASAAFLDYYKNSTISPRSNAYTAYVTVVQAGNLANDVAGQDDEYIDELHKIFAACQEAVENKNAMGVASQAAANAITEAENVGVVNGHGQALNVTDCKVKSTAEYEAKVALDLKRKAIADLETELVGEGYVPVADVIKEHKHYSCCDTGLSNLLDLERCNTNADCEPYGSPTDGHCVAGFCVLNPCVCNHTTTYVAGDLGSNTFADGFPIADDDCGVSEFTPFCGNGVCDISIHNTSSTAVQETFESCRADCKCGDGVCDHLHFGQFETGESCHNCQGDCPNTNAGSADSTCPTDPHKDGQCACYPSSASALNCEDETNAPDDCTCEVLCSGYSASDGLYSQSGVLSGATFAYQCPRYGDSGQNDCSVLGEVTLNYNSAANRGSFCSQANLHYTQPDGTVLVNSSFSGNLVHDVCKAVALDFITQCSKVPVTDEFGTVTMEWPDPQTSVAGLVANNVSSGLLSNCISIKQITGIDTQSLIDSLERWTNPPVPCDDDHVDVTLRTKIDPECIDWSMTPGCPASCSCPAAVQPIINSTLEVVKGSEIAAEIAENLCLDVCRCPEVGNVGETGHALSYIVSNGVYNATSGVVSTSVASGCLTVDSNPDEDCTQISSADYTLTNDYEAAVGQCVLGNLARVHRFECAANGGTQEVQTGCTPVTYAHATMAHNGSTGTNECYGLNGYDATDTTDTSIYRAPGCRSPTVFLADGVTHASGSDQLTGQSCFYGDGTDCKRGDKIAVGGTVVAAVVTTAGSGWSNGVLNGGGADAHTGGNRQCDEGETISNCAVDCHCGDGVCGSFQDYQGATQEEDSSICPQDCSFHCHNGVSGGCYEFQRRNYPVGNWDSDKDALFLDTAAGFEAYCSSWPENAAHLAVSGNTYAEIGGAGACPTPAPTPAPSPAPTPAPVGCSDAASDLAQACHQEGSNGVRGYDVNDGICDNPGSPNQVSAWAASIANAEKTYSQCQDLCDCGSAANGWIPTGDGNGHSLSRGRNHLRKRKLLGFEGIREWASKNLKAAQDEIAGKVSGMFRRKLLSLKPSDRTADVPWLQQGQNSFSTDYAVCLGSQSSTLANAISKAVKFSLGTNGFNTGNIVLGTDSRIDSAIANGYLVSSVAGENAIDLLAKQSLKAIQAELDKKLSQEGSCSSAQLAVVHKFSQSWVPTKKCYPLKFVQSIKHGGASIDLGYNDVSVLCSGIAQLSLADHNDPSPTTVSNTFDAYGKGRVQDSFLSLTREFSYLGYDKANIVDECTSEAANLCSADATGSRTDTTTNLANSCVSSDGSVYTDTSNSGSLSVFPGKVACVREFKNNLADIARHIDSSFQSTHMPYVGTSLEIQEYTMVHTYDVNHIAGTYSYENEEHSAFAHAHLDNFAPETRDHKAKFANQRALVGDKEDESLTSTSQGATGSIQACWESYENSVGYADENAWITASGALSQAIVAVEKESIAIISAHANAKAECKEKCEIETARDDWAHLVNACQGVAGTSGNGPSKCECRRASEATTAEDLANPDLVHCGCVVGANGGGIGDQLENLLGDGSEDCQLQPNDFITGSDSVQFGPTASGSTHRTGQYALVYAGQQPTGFVQSELNAIITKSQTDINTYVNSLVTNLQANLGAGGLLNQQGAGSLTQVCHRIHNAELATERQALDLSNVNSMDGFFANYLEKRQNGTLEDSSASRRLASEPCELCD